MLFRRRYGSIENPVFTAAGFVIPVSFGEIPIP